MSLAAVIAIYQDGNMSVQAGAVSRPVLAAALRQLADSLEQSHELFAAGTQLCQFGAQTDQPCQQPAVDFDNGTALCRHHFRQTELHR